MLPNKKVIRSTVNFITDYMRDLILDPDFVFEIGKIDFYKTSSLRFNGFYWTISVPISTNKLEQLIGPNPDMSSGRNGLNRSYLSGLIDGYLASKFGREIADMYFFWLDIRPIKQSKYTRNCILSLDEAIEKDVISAHSPLVSIMKECNCTRLVLNDGFIIGPNPDMIKAIDELSKKYSFSTVCDMFSGSGVLGKKCLLFENVKKVEFIDIQCEAIEENTKDIAANRFKIIKESAFNYMPNSHTDLFILDPYYDLSLVVAQKIVPRIKEKANAILFDMTLKADKYWSEQIQNVLKKTLGKIKCLEIGESKIAIWIK